MPEFFMIAIDILFAKQGSFRTYIGGVPKVVTIQELGPHTKPLPSLTFFEALRLAEGILTGAQTNETFRVGADDYEITVQDDKPQNVPEPAPVHNPQ